MSDSAGADICPEVPAAASSVGVFLHASSVVVPGGAVLFLGHSTAGKSTIARALEKWFPILADDTAFVSCDPRRGWVVADGSFRHQARGCSMVWDRVVELRPPTDPLPQLVGCVRIHKGAEVRLEPMAPLETCRHLMDAVMEVDLQRKLTLEETGPDRRATAREAQPGTSMGDADAPPEKTSAHAGPVAEPIRLPPRELMALKAKRAPSARELEMRTRWFHLVADIARTHPGWRLWFAKDRHLETLRATIESVARTIHQ